MRAVSFSQAGRALALAMLAGWVAGWLVLAAPAQAERFIAGYAPDVGVQTDGPGIGAGGGGGG